MHGRKGIKDESDESIVVRLRLKKVEKELLEAAADSGRLGSLCSKPSIGAVVVSLLRVALNCIQDHTEQYQSIQNLSKTEALAAGLRIKRRRK